MTKETKEAVMAEYRRRARLVDGNKCDCGKPAVKFTCGSFTCQRCLDLDNCDSTLNRVTHQLKTSTRRNPMKSRAASWWAGELAGFAKAEPFGWGPSWSLLERLK